MSLGPMELLICLIPVAAIVAFVVALILFRRRRIQEIGAGVSATPAPLEQPALESGGPEQAGGGPDRTGDAAGSEMPEDATANSRNGLATASLVLGILTVVIYPLLGSTWANTVGLLAIVTGAIGLLRIARRGGKGRAAAILGILLGCLPIFIVTAMLLFMAKG
jgi:hypothetical protein